MYKSESNKNGGSYKLLLQCFGTMESDFDYTSIYFLRTVSFSQAFNYFSR